eukprot:gb/GFBE01033942.1/.p1 GENE.gb/GFBE01033942.1/~~gb/GFBE01033942.1/.p1  ORF type:complete len:2008 (+),score=442.87 gb/GFBE01033942.1/:1-6024(+)
MRLNATQRGRGPASLKATQLVDDARQEGFLLLPQTPLKVDEGLSRHYLELHQGSSPRAIRRKPVKCPVRPSSSAVLAQPSPWQRRKATIDVVSDESSGNEDPEGEAAEEDEWDANGQRHKTLEQKLMAMSRGICSFFGHGGLTQDKIQQDVAEHFFAQTELLGVDCFAPMHCFRKVLAERGFEKWEIDLGVASVRRKLAVLEQDKVAQAAKTSAEFFAVRNEVFEGMQNVAHIASRYHNRTQVQSYTSICKDLAENAGGPQELLQTEEKLLESLQVSASYLSTVKNVINQSARLQYDASFVEKELKTQAQARETGNSETQAFLDGMDATKRKTTLKLKEDFVRAGKMYGGVLDETYKLTKLAAASEEEAEKRRQALDAMAHEKREMEERLRRGQRGQEGSKVNKQQMRIELEDEKQKLKARRGMLERMVAGHTNQIADLHTELQDLLCREIGAKQEKEAEHLAKNAEATHKVASYRYEEAKQRLESIESILDSLKTEVMTDSVVQEMERKQNDLLSLQAEAERLEAILKKESERLKQVQIWLSRHGQSAVAKSAREFVQATIKRQGVPDMEEVVLRTPLHLATVAMRLGPRRVRHNLRGQRRQRPWRQGLGEIDVADCPESVLATEQRRLQWGFHREAKVSDNAEAELFAERLWRPCLLRSSSEPPLGRRSARVAQAPSCHGLGGEGRGISALAAAPERRWTFTAETREPKHFEQLAKRLQQQWASLWSDTHELFKPLPEEAMVLEGIPADLGITVSYLWRDCHGPLKRLRNIISDGARGISLLQRLADSASHGRELVSQLPEPRTKAASLKVEEMKSPEDAEEEDLEQVRQNFTADLEACSKRLRDGLKKQQERIWLTAGVLAAMLSIRSRCFKMLELLKEVAEEQEDLVFQSRVLAAAASLSGSGTPAVAETLPAMRRWQRSVQLDSISLVQSHKILAKEWRALVSRSQASSPIAQLEANVFCDRALLSLPEDLERATTHLCIFVQGILRRRLHREDGRPMEEFVEEVSQSEQGIESDEDELRERSPSKQRVDSILSTMRTLSSTSIMSKRMARRVRAHSPAEEPPSRDQSDELEIQSLQVMAGSHVRRVNSKSSAVATEQMRLLSNTSGLALREGQHDQHDLGDEDSDGGDEVLFVDDKAARALSGKSELQRFPVRPAQRDPHPTSPSSSRAERDETGDISPFHAASDSQSDADLYGEDDDRSEDFEVLSSSDPEKQERLDRRLRQKRAQRYRRNEKGAEGKTPVVPALPATAAAHFVVADAHSGARKGGRRRLGSLEALLLPWKDEEDKSLIKIGTTRSEVPSQSEVLRHGSLHPQGLMRSERASRDCQRALVNKDWQEQQRHPLNAVGDHQSSNQDEMERQQRMAMQQVMLPRPLSARSKPSGTVQAAGQYIGLSLARPLSATARSMTADSSEPHDPLSESDGEDLPPRAGSSFALRRPTQEDFTKRRKPDPPPEPEQEQQEQQEQLAGRWVPVQLTQQQELDAQMDWQPPSRSVSPPPAMDDSEQQFLDAPLDELMRPSTPMWVQDMVDRVSRSATPASRRQVSSQMTPLSQFSADVCSQLGALSRRDSSATPMPAHLIERPGSAEVTINREAATRTPQESQVPRPASTGCEPSCAQSARRMMAQAKRPDIALPIIGGQVFGQGRGGPAAEEEGQRPQSARYSPLAVSSHPPARPSTAEPLKKPSGILMEENLSSIVHVKAQRERVTASRPCSGKSSSSMCSSFGRQQSGQSASSHRGSLAEQCQQSREQAQSAAAQVIEVGIIEKVCQDIQPEEQEEHQEVRCSVKLTPRAKDVSPRREVQLPPQPQKARQSGVASLVHAAAAAQHRMVQHPPRAASPRTAVVQPAKISSRFTEEELTGSRREDSKSDSCGHAEAASVRSVRTAGTSATKTSVAKTDKGAYLPSRHKTNMVPAKDARAWALTSGSGIGVQPAKGDFTLHRCHQLPPKPPHVLTRGLAAQIAAWQPSNFADSTGRRCVRSVAHDERPQNPTSFVHGLRSLG